MRTPPEDFDIRYSSLDDLSFLERCFSDLKEREPFPFESDHETQESLKNWIGFSRYFASLTGTLSEEPCAVGTLFLMPYRKVAHHASFFLIVDPKFRRRGIGTSMVRNLMHLSKTRFRLESLHVEFYEPNEPFRALLEVLNFKPFAVQDHFFKMGSTMRPRVLMEHFFS